MKQSGVFLIFNICAYIQSDKTWMLIKIYLKKERLAFLY